MSSVSIQLREGETDCQSTITTTTTTTTTTDGKEKLMPDYDLNKKGGEHASEALHTGQVRYHFTSGAQLFAYSFIIFIVSYMCSLYIFSCFCINCHQWDWHSYILNGQRQQNFAESCPITARCLDEIGDDLFCNTPFSFAFFSTLQGNAAIKVG